MELITIILGLYISIVFYKIIEYVKHPTEFVAKEYSPVIYVAKTIFLVYVGFTATPIGWAVLIVLLINWNIKERLHELYLKALTKS